MKNLTLLLFILMATHTDLMSQAAVDNILSSIEKNNTTLNALRKKNDAERTGNFTGKYLSDPEIGYDYLWGKPSDIGERKDFSIIQHFEFPTVYHYRNQVALLKNERLDIDYLKQLKELRLKALLLCIDVIYFNALEAEFIQRYDHAGEITGAVQEQFNQGASTILDLNKSEILLLPHIRQIPAVLL